MSGFGILFLIFATCTLLVGLYMYRGHKLELIAWKAAFKNLKKEGWINVGKWTMIASIPIYILGLLGLIFNW